MINMYYYYVVISRQQDRNVVNTDMIGKSTSRANAIGYFRYQLNAHVLNMIELTEEEYNELTANLEGNNDV